MPSDTASISIKSEAEQQFQLAEYDATGNPQRDREIVS